MPRGIDITTDVEKPGSRIRTLYIEEKDFYHKFAVFEFDRFNWGNLENAIKATEDKYAVLCGAYQGLVQKGIYPIGTEFSTNGSYLECRMPALGIEIVYDEEIIRDIRDKVAGIFELDIVARDLIYNGNYLWDGNGTARYIDLEIFPTDVEIRRTLNEREYLNKQLS
ncbi:hypothetical protein HOC35_06680 [Candidatus Woesearchaeota archaeon]|jgi:hypothetical protein|nr:hypothetical protein [Candidatus Woesearchaeota archaeon]